MNTVEQLRKSGYRVLINHYRYPGNVSKGLNKRQASKVKMECAFALSDEGLGISPFGGKTTIEVISQSGTSYTAEADCSVRDNFNKRMGVKIALGRILKQMGIEKSE